MCSEVKTTGPNLAEANLAEDVFSSFYAAAWSERGALPNYPNPTYFSPLNIPLSTISLF
jgi:hypothetical protein